MRLRRAVGGQVEKHTSLPAFIKAATVLAPRTCQHEGHGGVGAVIASSPDRGSPHKEWSRAKQSPPCPAPAVPGCQ